MKRIVLRSVFGAFEYVMDHYYPYGLDEYAQKKDTYAVISIQDTHTGGFGFRFCINRYCRDVLTLYFDDVVTEGEGTVLFTEGQAGEVIDFIEKNRDIETLLVHCYGGQSRSRAVAAFAAKMLGAPYEKYFENGNPNMHVFRTLEAAWEKREGQTYGTAETEG